MKSWEWESEIRKEALEETCAFTEAERERADKAEEDARALREELAKYKAKYGDIA